MGAQTNAPLPDGLEIGGYRIVRRIASGGFSIVYLAEDARGEQFAIKEYLPSSLVKRQEGELVPAIEDKNIATFRNGLKCFFGRHHFGAVLLPLPLCAVNEDKPSVLQLCDS